MRVSGRVQDGSDVHADFDTVVAAIGRVPDTSKLGLQHVRVAQASSGKIVCAGQNDQTSVLNIYAIGDVVEGMLELTPVAIQAGILLARRLYGLITRHSPNHPS